jgi:hypothetical protein
MKDDVSFFNRKDYGFDTRRSDWHIFDSYEARVEAVSNTSTVTLLVVGGNETETQCLGV